MEIVVTQMTRMSVGFICVAGIDPDTGRHVRPVTGHGRLTAAMLGRNGGPFELGRRLDLGPTRSVGSPPEVEDQLFRPDAVRVVGEASSAELARLLGSAGARNLKGIFGDDLVAQGRTAAVETGRGKASLGCLLAPLRPRLMLEYGKVKMSLSDGVLELVASVTDLQLYADDYVTPQEVAIRQMNADLARMPAFVNVGLSRQYLRPGDTVERHWLQVNTILFDRTVGAPKEGATDEGAIADRIVEMLDDLRNPLSLTMLTHLLRGSSGPATLELVRRSSPRNVGLLKAATFSKARDLVEQTCRTDRRIELLDRKVSLKGGR